VAGAASLPERGRAVAAKGGACWGTPRRRHAHLGTEFAHSVGGGALQARTANGAPAAALEPQCLNEGLGELRIDRINAAARHGHP
jgi:hypothetical protein